MHRGVLPLTWLLLAALAPLGAADDQMHAGAQGDHSALVASYADQATDAAGQAPEEIGHPAATYDYADGEAIGTDEGSFGEPQEFFGALPDPFEPARAVSSSNWLRNCCWYTEQSAIYMTRTANPKNDVRLAAETINPFSTVIAQSLDVSLDPGYQPGLRSTIGKYLGNDPRNRTHSVEFTFLGLTHWSVAQSLTADTPGTLSQRINPMIAVPVYDDSDEQSFGQSADFNSYELNYRVERRLGRDRLVYSRDSEWVREATPTLLCSVMAGLRVAIVNESINWDAISEQGSGSYDVVTHNNMVGPQVGGELFYERAYWRTGVRVNGGALVNWASQSSIVRILAPDGSPLEPNRDEFAKQHTLAFVGGLNLIGEYRFRPNFGLRVSYDMIWATDLALAQNQITFLPSTPAEISTSHTLFFHGATFGFEWFR